MKDHDLIIVSCQLHNTSPRAPSHSLFSENHWPDPNHLAPGAHSYFEKLQVLALLPISYLWSQVLQSYVVVQKLWWPGVATLSCLHVHLMKSQSQKLGSAFTEMHGLNAWQEDSPSPIFLFRFPYQHVLVNQLQWDDKLSLIKWARSRQ